MMNRKQASTSLAIVGMALLATVMTMSYTPTPALALGHWNLDENFTPNNGFAKDGMDSSGTTDNTNEEDSTTAATTDEDEEEGSEDSGDGSNDKEDSSHIAYDDLQACLSDAEGEGSPTEQEVQDCIETSYGEIESGEKDHTESTDDDHNEDRNDMTEGLSTDDTKEEEQSEDQS